MTRDEAIRILKNYNRWRRGAEIPQPPPFEIGIAIDTAINLLSEKHGKYDNNACGHDNNGHGHDHHSPKRGEG